VDIGNFAHLWSSVSQANDPVSCSAEGCASAVASDCLFAV
jgi:hypothetical protein